MIPQGTRFIGIAPTVNLTERKSASINAETQPYTIDDIRGYKVYTALLTQSGGDSFETISEGALTKGVTYYITGGSLDRDFTNVGGPKGIKFVYFVATESSVPNDYGGSILEFNTGAPVATVLENTIGDIYWTREGNSMSVGFYSANLTSAFTENKTFLLIGTPNDNYSSGTGIFEIYNDWSLPNGEDKVYINTGLGAGLSYNYSDDMLYNTSFEIRVYN